MYSKMLPSADLPIFLHVSLICECSVKTIDDRPMIGSSDDRVKMLRFDRNTFLEVRYSSFKSDSVTMLQKNTVSENWF